MAVFIQYQPGQPARRLRRAAEVFKLEDQHPPDLGSGAPPQPEAPRPYLKTRTSPGSRLQLWKQGTGRARVSSIVRSCGRAAARPARTPTSYDYAFPQAGPPLGPCATPCVRQVRLQPEYGKLRPGRWTTTRPRP